MRFDTLKKPVGKYSIDALLRSKYPDLEPHLFLQITPFRNGGDEPLELIAAYSKNDLVPHWHFVTYGFSDLYEKTSKNSPVSGYGFEVTFRLVKAINEKEPPLWCMEFLQNIAKFVFTTGNRFDNGSNFMLNKETSFHSSNALSAMAFTYDPELKPINTPNGIVVFLQLVGITADERLAMQAWNSTKFFETIKSELPLYETDLQRKSLLEKAHVKRLIQEGINNDGSSTEMIITKRLTWQEQKKIFGKKNYEINFPNENFDEIENLLKFRLAKGRELIVIGTNQKILLGYREEPSTSVNEFEIRIFLDEKGIKDLVHKFSSKNKSFEVVGLKNVVFKLV